MDEGVEAKANDLISASCLMAAWIDLTLYPSLLTYSQPDPVFPAHPVFPFPVFRQCHPGGKKLCGLGKLTCLPIPAMDIFSIFFATRSVSFMTWSLISVVSLGNLNSLDFDSISSISSIMLFICSRFCLYSSKSTIDSTSLSKKPWREPCGLLTIFWWSFSACCHCVRNLDLWSCYWNFWLDDHWPQITASIVLLWM